MSAPGLPRGNRTITALVFIALTVACGGASTDGSGDANCLELTEVMMEQAQDDLWEMELWPPEEQAALDAHTLATRSELLYAHTVLTRLGDESCGADELLVTWCDQIHELSAGSDFGSMVRELMIESQCGDA